jgi:hypothetical protein
VFPDEPEQGKTLPFYLWSQIVVFYKTSILFVVNLVTRFSHSCTLECGIEVLSIVSEFKKQ